MQRAPRFRVDVIDSERGDYVRQLDVERAVLSDVAALELHRVDAPDDLIGRVESADAVISWHTVPLPARVLSAMGQCRGIVRAAVGFDNIDIACAARLGIPVANVPDYGTEEVADHTFALMLALVRRIARVDESVRRGSWDWRSIGRVPRLRGVQLGIVGFGRIGGAVARRAHAFGLAVGFYDPYAPSGVEKSHGVTRFESLYALLEAARIVSLHVPLSDETRGLIDLEALRRIGRDGILINTSRGEVVDQEALVAALAQGLVGQAGLDVLAEEPKVPDALRASDRVLLTAHSAFYADASLAELRRKAAEAVRRLLLGQTERSVVNGVTRNPHLSNGGASR